MGLHISIMSGGKDHPNWDYGRQGSDRQFPCLLDGIDIVRNKADDELFRPKSIDCLRHSINETKWDDMDRYLHLCDLIEADDTYWIHFGW